MIFSVGSGQLPHCPGPITIPKFSSELSMRGYLLSIYEWQNPGIHHETFFTRGSNILRRSLAAFLLDVKPSFLMY
jgi:hypothetical protein